MTWLLLLALGVVSLIAAWMATAAVTVWVAHRRGGATWRWAVLGLLLGPFGIWLATHHVRRCLQCDLTVLNEVRTCPACGFDIPRRDPADNPVGPLWSYRKDW